VIHEKAVVHETARLGEGTVVWSGAVVGAGVRTGPHCAIGSNAYIGAGTSMGESCRLQHGVFLPNRSRLGARVFMGPNATATDDRMPKVNNPTYRSQPPTLEDDCAIGAGAVLLPGVRIGRGAMVGAGAVVTRDVDDHQTVFGNPARVYVRERV
jgi:acetyltransferase-like isoleucine patch superfamily enzyme